MLIPKDLRERAWALQNRISGRPGISTPAISLEISSEIYRFASEVVRYCGDAEACYLAPCDYEEMGSVFAKKMQKLEHILDKAVVPQVPVMKNTLTTYQTCVDAVPIEQITPSVVNLEIVDLIENKLISNGLLNLAGLKITDNHVDCIFNVLKNSECSSIDLSENDLSCNGAQKLAVFFVSNCFDVKVLNLQSNPRISASGKQALNGLSILRKDLSIVL